MAYYHVPKVKQSNKLELRAKPAVFLGIAESTLGYRLLDLETGSMMQQRSVHVREDVAGGGFRGEADGQALLREKYSNAY